MDNPRDSEHLDWRLEAQHFHGTRREVGEDLDRLIVALVAMRRSLLDAAKVRAMGTAARTAGEIRA